MAQEYFVFFRSWPGFTAPFPFERFNALPDGKIGPALFAYAREERKRPGVWKQLREKTRGEWQEFIRDYSEGLDATNRKKLPYLWRKFHDDGYHNLMVCRLGHHLGWWKKPEKQNWVWSPRVWFYRTESLQVANQLVSLLNEWSDRDCDAQRDDCGLNPRFSFVESAQVPSAEIAHARASIGAAVSNSTPPTTRRAGEDFVVQHAVMMARNLEAGGAAIDRSLTPTLFETTIDIMFRTLTRHGKVVEFGQKNKAWQLFARLYLAGEEGKTRRQLWEDLWPDSKNSWKAATNFDGTKDDLNRLLETIDLEVSKNSEDKWAIAELRRKMSHPSVHPPLQSEAQANSSQSASDTPG